jgi:all-trans-retinol 13,14-reductase
VRGRFTGAVRSSLPGVAASPGHLSLYLGLRGTARELGLDGTNLWIYDDPDHDRAFERFERDVEAPFPGIYLSFPSAKAPPFETRFPGRATMEAITMGTFAPFAHWEETRWAHRGTAYDDLKARLRERLLAAVEARLPQLKGRIELAELSTPLSTRHFAAHPRGEIYGLAATPRRFEADPPVRTAIPGLFLTGADAAMSGLTGALAGAGLAASAILKENTLAAIRTETDPGRRVQETA